MTTAGSNCVDLFLWTRGPPRTRSAKRLGLAQSGKCGASVNPTSHSGERNPPCHICLGLHELHEYRKEEIKEEMLEPPPPNLTHLSARHSLVVWFYFCQRAWFLGLRPGVNDRPPGPEKLLLPYACYTVRRTRVVECFGPAEVCSVCWHASSARASRRMRFC